MCRQKMIEDEGDVVDSGGAALSRTVFEPAHVIRRILAGSGRCQVCPSGLLAAAALDTLNFVDLRSGQAVKRIVLVRRGPFFFFAAAF